MALVAIKLTICCFRGTVPRKAVLFSLLGSEGASCPFTQSVSPICQPSFSVSLSPHTLCHHEPAAHSPSHGHMSLERIYYTISSFRESCKEASQGDKALRVKSSPTDPNENTPIRTLSVSAVPSVEFITNTY